MFHKLRNNFILTTMSLLTIVVVVSFSAIYVGTTNDFRDNRARQSLPVGLRTAPFDEEQLRTYIDEQRQENANRLALTLVLTGAITLVAGYFISRYIAETAIKPVREAYDKQKQFIADASHELKTPLAVIDANIEAELSDQKNPSKWLKNIQAETERMDRLIKDLLMLAKFDAANGSAPEQFDVAELVKGVILPSYPLVKSKSLRLTEHIESPLIIESHKDKLRQIVAVLIDNAIKYTSEGGKMEVITRLRDNQVEVIVSNTHKPLTQKKLDKLFDRFYQADVSHKNQGYGLGLAIAKAAADSIGATLSVSQADGVISFRVTL